MTRAELAENRDLLDLAAVAPHAGLAAELRGTERCATVGRVLTAWTLCIEGAVAVAFLWPARRGVVHARNALLATFLVTTYSVLPVLGFAFLLATLGLAASVGHRRWCGAFVAAALLVEAASLPWQGWIS